MQNLKKMKNKLLNNRVGEKHLTNKCGFVEIIDYKGIFNCTVRFEDGTIKENVQYYNITTGSVAKDIKRIGEEFIDKND